MQVRLTELDRKDLQRHAWELVRRLPWPRQTRILMRDKLVMELAPKLVAQREAEQQALVDKWKP